MKKIAVVGGGIFGCTAAIFAARAGHEVHLFEKNDGLLKAASGINQYRLHRGYHYPRSSETATAARDSESSFKKEYGNAVIEDGRHLYAIAKEGSKVSKDEFLAFCDQHSLEYTHVPMDGIVNPDVVDALIEGVESRFDPDALRSIVERNLRDANVQAHLSSTLENADAYDRVVVATYAHTNATLRAYADVQQEYQFEVCEKPVVRMPASFSMIDLVVMDGPFMCVDPLGKTGLHVLGNVDHAIHATNVGFDPIVPESIQPHLNAGVVTNPAVSKYKTFIEHGSTYIPSLSNAEYVGSMFTIRTVLPRLEKTDARPTLVTAVDDKYIQIFSGKIGNCVEAAEKVVELL